LDSGYRAASDGVAYGQSTPQQQIGSDFANHPVTASVSGLVPNAVYHARLVATNSAGTTYGPDQTFTTKQDPPPPPPVLGRSVDVMPVSGLVLIKPPPGKKLGPAGDAHAGALSKGQGFVPLTEARQIPTGSQIDARRGTLAITSATDVKRKTQTGTFSAGLFKLTQGASKAAKGLTTLSLLEGAFAGAPSYASCPKPATDPRRVARAAVSSRILQTLHARDNHGRFATRGRYSAATVRGTQWDTVDRCDGTLTAVQRGTVSVNDFVRHVTVIVPAGHRYLARAKHG
jgi:hypothetical protein